MAVGGIATFFSSILATFFGLGMWMPFGLLAALLAISGPSMLIAWLKLRQRNIGPMLDANGWAVNALARINVPFGGALTGVAALPAGASRSLRDPFAEKKTPWGFYVFVAVLLVLGRRLVLRQARHLPAGQGEGVDRAASLAHTGALGRTCREVTRRPAREKFRGGCVALEEP